MFVIPVSFNEYGKELLGRFQHFVSKGWVAVSNVGHQELVTQMRIVRFKDNGNLDKDETSGSTFDLLDATGCALKMLYTVGKQ
jgi:hypothetical protein